MQVDDIEAWIFLSIFKEKVPPKGISLCVLSGSRVAIKQKNVGKV